MTPRLHLQLDVTGQYLGGPVLGPHDNRLAVARLLKTQLAELQRVSGH